MIFTKPFFSLVIAILFMIRIPIDAFAAQSIDDRSGEYTVLSIGVVVGISTRGRRLKYDLPFSLGKGLYKTLTHSRSRINTTPLGLKALATGVN